MKIEKINDNQIRCTLTREDLANRKIKLSELAYGSDKAKSLFQDMMQQAAREFGFEANNIPLMIEAIPVSADSVILIVTKVEDPDELDTRFSRFSSEDASPGSGRGTASLAESITGADDILDLIQKISSARKKSVKKSEVEEDSASDRRTEIQQEEIPSIPEDMEDSDEIFRLTRFYLFRDLDTVIRASRVAGGNYAGPNALFKNPDDNNYYLILTKADTDPEHFNKICNILSEYALQVNYTAGMEEYFTEHMDVIVPQQAMQQLGGI
ncbi:MAG: adaptor protein MecA [Lachnospiraceae bacterium]|nr:adaptor protein MecA [Lachnospiraceae bacterium]